MNKPTTLAEAINSAFPSNPCPVAPSGRNGLGEDELIVVERVTRLILDARVDIRERLDHVQSILELASLAGRQVHEYEGEPCRDCMGARLVGIG